MLQKISSWRRVQPCLRVASMLSTHGVQAAASPACWLRVAASRSQHGDPPIQTRQQCAAVAAARTCSAWRDSSRKSRHEAPVRPPAHPLNQLATRDDRENATAEKVGPGPTSGPTEGGGADRRVSNVRGGRCGGGPARRRRTPRPWCRPQERAAIGLCFPG